MKKNLVLTGMMGVGKSTIGKDLASKLDIQFKDVDKIKLFKMKVNSGPSAARDYGVKKAQGDIIFFTDSDTIFLENPFEQKN